MLKLKSIFLLIILSSGVTAYAAAPVTQIDSATAVSATADNSSGAISSPAVSAPVVLTADQQLAQQQNQIQYLQSQISNLNTLQQTVSDLRGHDEVLSHQVDQLQLSVKLLTDRMVSLEAARKINQPNNSALSVSPNTNINTKEIGVANNFVAGDAAYTKAYNLINQNRYDDAISAFNQFLTQYPASPHAAGANYWLGELYMVKGQPDQATQEFRKVLSFKGNDHIPDALRQLGIIYLANGDSAHAKQMFTRVIKEYPGTSAAAISQKQLDGMN